MILVDGEKYACEQCIRGHRSSTCKHIKRRLVLVRSRGRPITDSSQRIAITAEEVSKTNITICDGKSERRKKSPDKKKHSCQEEDRFCRRTKCSCCARASLTSSHSSSSASSLTTVSGHTSNSSATSSTTCGCEAECTPVERKNSIFVLKASRRRIYNVDKTSLKLLEPVAEIPNNRVGLEMMHNTSRIKKHGRTSCRSKNFTTGELLLNFQGCGSARTGSCCSNSKNCPKMKYSCSCFPQEKHTKSNTRSTVSVKADNIAKIKSSTAKQKQMYDLFLADMCTLPGTCSCDPSDCKCTDCIEHNGITKDSLKQKPNCKLPSQESTILQVGRPCFDAKDAGKPLDVNLFDQSPKDTSTFPGGGVISFGQVGVQPAVDQPTCPKGLNLGDHPISQAPQNSDFKKTNTALGEVGVKQLNVPFIDNSPESNVSSSSVPECLCEPSECACYNCEKHGIVNGVRMADGVRVSCLNEFPIEMQLAYSMPNYASQLEMESHNSTTAQTTSSSDGHSYDFMVRTEAFPGYESGLTHNGILQRAKSVPVDDVTQPTSGESLVQSENRNANDAGTFAEPKMGEIMIDFSDFDATCNCADGECTCTNCFKHGRFGNVDIV
ncbi:hypothetical protein HII13_001192 [Brettanomyces bruxellensis]|nr:hypothetical protein HII13_001192 [Brettanomyces bruxellensis]